MSRPAGYKHTAASRAKMRDAWTHRPPIDKETRVRMDAAHRGCHLSAEIRAAISARTKGEQNPNWKKPASAEQRAKQSAAMRGRPQPKGDQSPSWKGGRAAYAGYEYVQLNPGFYLSVHRHKMAQTLGRKLQKGEEVHHINKNRLDNRIENLALCSDMAAHNWCRSEESKILFG